GSSSYESSSSFQSGGAANGASAGYSFGSSGGADAASAGFGFGGGAAVAEFGGAANGHESAYSSQGGFESAGGVNNSFAS
ncbi:unnamed protein product, partial [Rotaria magnacalcarata]